MNKFKIIGESVEFEDEQQVVGYEYEIIKDVYSDNTFGSMEALFTCQELEKFEYLGTFHVFSRGGENDDTVIEGYTGIAIIPTDTIEVE